MEELQKVDNTIVYENMWCNETKTPTQIVTDYYFNSNTIKRICMICLKDCWKRWNETMTEEYKDPGKLSECCAAEMYSDYDICPKCGEHTTSMETDDSG